MSGASFLTEFVQSIDELLESQVIAFDGIVSGDDVTLDYMLEVLRVAPSQLVNGEVVVRAQYARRHGERAKKRSDRCGDVQDILDPNTHDIF